MSRDGLNLQYLDSPRREPCPRCGAAKEEPCDPISDGHEHASILRYHPERGARPWWLIERGYEPYMLVDQDGFTLNLWKRPGQRPVDRRGYVLVVEAGKKC